MGLFHFLYVITIQLIYTPVTICWILGVPNLATVGIADMIILAFLGGLSSTANLLPFLKESANTFNERTT